MNPEPARQHTAMTGPDYWEAAWRAADLPEPLDPNGTNPLFRLLHHRFKRFLSSRDAPGKTLVEIGCGGSRWLPYFKREYGLSVAGIDYSPLGCESACRILENAGASGEIVQGDLFTPPEGWKERFDVVVSFGLVEHFADTADAVSACAAYLRPGGRMITLVPTMRGLYGLAYRLLDRRVYAAHLPLTKAELAEAHRGAGLEVVDCVYLLGLPGVLGDKPPGRRLSRMHALIARASRAYWWLERHGLGVPPNRFTSPYALCLARKPGGPT